jgi:hypothetical protein
MLIDEFKRGFRDGWRAFWGELGVGREEPMRADLMWYAAPMTRDNARAWEGMVQDGMDPRHAYERMAQWAAMLEERVAKLDPQYRNFNWGMRP